MSAQLLSILETIEREKGIDREVLLQAVEAALVSAARKTASKNAEEVAVTVDRLTGNISIISDGKEVASADFGRIAAQTAKQVIIQKIREAEREVIFNEFSNKVGDIVSGSVHRFEHGAIIADVGRAEAILPKVERIPRETYRQGERLQAFILDVQKSAKGPQVILSRVHIGLVKGLFALEVPEIFEGIVEIRSVAREPGDRSKISVSSKNEKVDCVGACVGMRGTRVKNIVRELHGEKIDIVRFSEDTREYISAALSPAQIHDIRLNQEQRSALVIVVDDQLSLAIGKRGQNVRLASKLTTWNLDIKSRSELAKQDLPAMTELPGIGPAAAERLQAAGFDTLDKIGRANVEGLTEVPGIGPKTAEKMIANARGMLEKAGISSAELILGISQPKVEEAPLDPFKVLGGGTTPAEQAETAPITEEPTTASAERVESAVTPPDDVPIDDTPAVDSVKVPASAAADSEPAPGEAPAADAAEPAENGSSEIDETPNKDHGSA